MWSIHSQVFKDVQAIPRPKRPEIDPLVSLRHSMVMVHEIVEVIARLGMGNAVFELHSGQHRNGTYPNRLHSGVVPVGIVGACTTGSCGRPLESRRLLDHLSANGVTTVEDHTNHLQELRPDGERQALVEYQEEIEGAQGEAIYWRNMFETITAPLTIYTQDHNELTTNAQRLVEEGIERMTFQGAGHQNEQYQ
ncbi:uncharacterized protein LY89DRAFT_669120 [Mollisia scopiformis]|uniref:Uncharacterized protein n=1 Tax=Mollisia scopiformis TaxID=149040 RepID=A0A194XCD9_MOLSC|nr:uncharacterized protein LY89DRAFT_669120 [Mollisia scopiformis]KUJ17835.1 hypothetical protein LY89DRAFT_669120 [Mollisia scopiformis]